MLFSFFSFCFCITVVKRKYTVVSHWRSRIMLSSYKTSQCLTDPGHRLLSGCSVTCLPCVLRSLLLVSAKWTGYFNLPLGVNEHVNMCMSDLMAWRLIESIHVLSPMCLGETMYPLVQVLRDMMGYKGSSMFSETPYKRQIRWKPFLF